MGNSPPSATSLRLSNGDQPCKVQLGDTIDIYFRGREAKQQANGKIIESWRLSYSVYFTICEFRLTKSPHRHDEKLHIKIEDGIGHLSETLSYVTVEAGILGLSICMDVADCGSFGITRFPILTASTANAEGGITETSFNIYWHQKGKWRVLMVCELKKRSKDEKPYMGTVSHYFAYMGNGREVGLSVVVKRIRVSDDGHLDFAVDGPEQHPATALFHMFDEVRRTGTWKPTYCPHCANSNIIQRQHSMSWQSESEDSDKGDVPTALLHRRRQNAGGILANDGMVKGNNNGNLIINISAQKADTASTEYGKNSINGLSKIVQKLVGLTSHFDPKS